MINANNAAVVAMCVGVNEIGSVRLGEQLVWRKYPLAPVNQVAPAISGHPSDGSVLQVTRGKWEAYPYPTYSYEWKSDGVSVGTDQNTYETQPSDVGQEITCEITSTNTEDAIMEPASNSITVTLSAAPVNTVAPVLSGLRPFGSTMTVTTGTWTGNPTPTFSYQWKADGVNVGTDQATYVTQAADTGKDLRCTVTATNRKGSASHNSNTINVLDPDAR